MQVDKQLQLSGLQVARALWSAQSSGACSLLPARVSPALQVDRDVPRAPGCPATTNHTALPAKQLM